MSIAQTVEKESDDIASNIKSSEGDSHFDFGQFDDALLQLPEHFSKPAGKKAVQQELQPSDKLDNFINHVNNRSLAWKANECLLRNATCEAPNESSLV